MISKSELVFKKGDRVRISIPKTWGYYQKYNNATGVVYCTDEESQCVWIKLDNFFQTWNQDNESFRANAEMLTRVTPIGG